MDSFESHEGVASEDGILFELEACEERIAQLELKLATEYELRDSILQGIENEGFMITTIPAISLPNETLLQIFESLVEEDSLAIASVLLVCHKWHHLVMSQESLWSRLSFRVPKRRVLKYLRASQQYTDMALLRSRERLLDITIDFRNIKDLDTVTFEEACIRLPKNVVATWLQNWHSHCIPNRKETCVFSEITQTLFANFICSLTRAGTTAHRWRTATFKTRAHLAYNPEDMRYDLSNHIFNGYEMPALERVDLLDYNAHHMATIPKTKHLLIHSKFLSSQSKTVFRALEKLHLRVNSFFPGLGSSTTLRSLSVHFLQDVEPEVIPPDLLRSLETLSVRGPSAHALLDGLEMPRLRALRLIGKDAIQSASRLVRHSNLRSLQILAAEGDAATIQAFVMARAAEIVGMEYVTIMPWHLDIVIEWIKSPSAEPRKRQGEVRTVEWIVRTMQEEDLEEELWRSDVTNFIYQTHHIA
jgi:hypothetical protein